MGRLEQILERAASTIDEPQVIAPTRDIVYLGAYDFGTDLTTSRLSLQSYESQWSVEDLGWEQPYDPQVVAPLRDEHPRVPAFHPGSMWSDEEWQRYEIANLRYLMSQLLHAEQLSVAIGGSLCTSAPGWDLKTFGGWLAVDEARHAESLHRYLERVGGAYPMSGQMADLVKHALETTQWDQVFLVGQILVEGMGLGTLGHLLASYSDPLLVDMTKLIQRDEARHVAFGATQLPELINGLSSAEILERQQLLAHCTEIVMDKLVPVMVAEEFGIDPRQYARALRMSPTQHKIEQRLYSHVTPLCQRLGLMDANNGWLRVELERMGLLPASA